MNQLSALAGVAPAYREIDKSSRFVIAAEGFRMPFETEWELAARGGDTHRYAGSDERDEVAWNRTDGMHPVGLLKASGSGCYDLSGNVREWCADDYRNPGLWCSSSGIRSCRNALSHVSHRYGIPPNRSSGLRLFRAM